MSASAVRFGDEALRFAIPGGTDRRALLHALRKIVSDAVLTETIGMVLHDGDPARAERAITESLAASRGEHARGCTHTIEVVYDGEDLDAVASALTTTRDVIVGIHADPTYEVAMLGFQPGFAYLRGGDPRLAFPRRASPRTRVPPRSVAIAAGYTGIYPSMSPGGWHLLGRAPSFVAFDARGAALALGDRVRFVPSTAAEPAIEEQEKVHAIPREHLEIVSLKGVALLVDGGRRGHMHEGVPHGGPLVSLALGRTNASVGNARGTCAIELYGAMTLAARGRAFTIGDVNGAQVLAPDATRLCTAAGARVGYVSVEGGFDVPEIMGSKSTLSAASVGGFEGRLLRTGDRLVVGARSRALNEEAHARPLDDNDEITIAPGPDGLSLAPLLGASFKISTSSSRTGTRLDGPPLPVDPELLDRPSAPMICGAIEITPHGLIVLGPDHPTTGGYPVIAVLEGAERDRFFARRLGSTVRFRL